jgi:phosphoribosylamine--glycine ligase
MAAKWRDETALTVVMATHGYPGKTTPGSAIGSLEKARGTGVEIFQAGTALRDGQLVANGGRVLNVTALGKTVREAQEKAYRAVDLIDWPEGFCRRDIGWRAVAREHSL